MASYSRLFLPILIFSSTLFIITAQGDDDEVSSSSAVYYEQPSLARLSSAVSRQVHKGCIYNKKKYINGQEVDTDQPCLQCTCKKGILLCALRVCPPLSNANSSSPNSRCEVVRDPNTCCPSLKCVTAIQNEFGVFYTELKTPERSTLAPAIDVDRSSIENDDPPERANSQLTVKHLPLVNTTILQTVPSSNYPDKETDEWKNSPLLIPRPSMNLNSYNKQQYLSELLDGFGKHCYVNGTFYAEGSAIMSPSYCEYCYCIRGKRMCIRPRCHLSILGCLPKYTNEYACCPTSYACGDEALANDSDARQWPLSYMNENLFYNEELPIETTTLPAETTTELKVETTTATTTTTTTSAPTTVSARMDEEARKSVIQLTECIMDEIVYKLGDSMPADGHCSHCFCSTDGVRACKQIQCSLFTGDDHCTPVIPEGHCCPVEYRCSSTVSKLKNDSTTTTTTPPPTTKLQTELLQEINSANPESSPAVNETKANPINEEDDDESNLVLFNSHKGIITKFNPERKALNSSKDLLPLEARNLNDPVIHGKEDLLPGSKNSTVDAAKYENVANFLNNIFTALGFTGQNIQQTPIVEHHQPVNPQPINQPPINLNPMSHQPLHQNPMNHQGSMLMVESDENSKPTLVKTTNGEQIEILTVQPDSVDIEERPPIPVGSIYKDSTHQIKSVRELPYHMNYLSKNHLMPMQLLQKAPSFANGWRAVPNHHHHHRVTPIRRPIPSVEQLYAPERISSTSTTTTTTTTPPPTTIAAIVEPETSITHATSTTTLPPKVDLITAKCSFEGVDYKNGELIPNKLNDPCIFCRCFYGKQICQEHKCPLPPSNDCVGEKNDGQCCMVYTCGTNSTISSTTEPSTASTEPVESKILPLNIQERSPIRKEPQYALEPERFERDNKPIAMAMSVPPYQLPPHQAHRLAFPFDALPRPIDLIYKNRIHFPNKQHHPQPQPKPAGIYGGQPIMPNIVPNKPFLNRPLYPYPINPHPHPHLKPNNEERIKVQTGSGSSTIRTRPQSPIQPDKPLLQPIDEGTTVMNLRPPPTPSPSTTTTTAATSGTRGTGEPWNIFQLSGCNIYGKMHKINEEIKDLSADCKKCVCTSMGVQCKQIC